MANRIFTSKKSTTKYRKFKTSPIIPVVAIIEVIVLLAVCTYTWFIFSASKEMNSGIINVDTDSGLDIDFKNVTTKEVINIWDYVGKDFRFEPCTSLDGRNLYFPTSGTFDNNNTSSIKFRDATINDINSKYLDIDFELSNTSNQNMSVYLSDESHFLVRDTSDQKSDSKALRLAFYLNDGEGGDVSPQLLKNSESEQDDSTKNLTHVYFDNSSTDGWTNVYAYVWKSSDGNDYLKAFPGSLMTRIYGKTYEFAFDNSKGYDKILFTDNAIDVYGEYGHKTVDLNLSDNTIYKLDGTSQSYSTKTIYFNCPDDWTDLKVAAWKNGGETYTSDGGDPMTFVTGNVYSFTVNANADTVYFWDKNNESGHKYDATTCIDNTLYYFNAQGTRTTEPWGMTNIYFYNTNSWSKPVAYVTSRTGKHYTFTMSSLTGGVYYCTIPNICTGHENSNYSKLYFSDGDSTTNRTIEIGHEGEGITAGNIYYCSKEKAQDSQYYDMTTDNYDSYTKGGSYAVISPGVSAGFQRSYSPVVKIDKQSGASQTVVPAFSYSLDNYVYGSENPMFTLKSGQRLSLSMVIWLEGTDEDCTENYYAEHLIDLYLKFATVLSGEDTKQTYNYCFYDNTKEVWTSDKVTNDAGVSVSPVMQLYDTVKGRGYLMTPKSYTTYNGKRKVDMWQCTAPQNLVTETGHNLEFRRVNPYNESEIWNVWRAGTGRQTKNPDASANIITDALKDGYVSYTAFADGSPTHDSSSSILESDTERDQKVPTLSCGGLWGNHETVMMTLNDQSVGRVIKQSGQDGLSGLCTINFIYKYDCGYEQTIEYKASGTKYNDLYVFVVPKNVVRVQSSDTYDSGKAPQNYLGNGDVYFKHYTKYDTRYAINSNKNDSITFDKSWKVPAGTYGMYGKFVQINERYSSDKENESYWGKDLEYINLSNSEKAGEEKINLFNDNAKFKVHYMYVNSQDSKSGSNRYSYLNNSTYDDDFKLDGYNVYLSVVPQATPTTETPDTIWSRLSRTNSTDGDTWNYSTSDWDYSTTSNMITAYKWDSSKSDNYNIYYIRANNSDFPGRQNTSWPVNYY